MTLNTRVQEKLSNLGLEVRDPEKSRASRRKQMLETLAIMPDREVLMKPGDDHMIVDLVEAALDNIFEVLADRSMLATHTVGSPIGVDLVASLITKYAAEAFAAMQTPILANLLDKRGVAVLMHALNEGDGLRQKLRGEDAIAFLDAHGCDCQPCHDARRMIKAGTHVLLVQGDTYVGLEKLETIQ